MRIVWAAAYGGRQRGGFIPALERVARRLIARGDSIEVVVPDVGGAPWYDDVRAGGVTLHVVSDGRAAARRVAQLRGDVVHAHFHDWLVPVTLATWPTRARLLWHLHSTFQPDGGALRITPRRAVKYRVLGARVFRFVCVTRTIAAEARALGASARKTVVVPNAVDTARFRPPTLEERAIARTRLSLGDGPAIAFFGRDPAIKGADVLAEALPHLPGVTVVAVATPEATVAELARHARVIAVPFTDDVREALWPVDAVALPSRGEGLPFVALEAIACGIRVVAAELPWSVELAERSGAVRLAPPGNGPALARALSAALAERPARPAGAADELDGWAEQVVSLYDLASSRRPGSYRSASAGM